MCLYHPLIARGEAQIAATKGDTGSSLESCVRAEALTLQMGMRPMLWQVRSDAARLLGKVGRLEEAEVARRKAQATIDEIASLFKDSELRAEFVSNAMNKVA